MTTRKVPSFERLNFATANRPLLRRGMYRPISLHVVLARGLLESLKRDAPFS